MTAGTATVNEVKYAEDRRAVLHPLPVNGSHPPPVDIPISELERHVTIDDDDPDKPNPYEKAEVYWPLDLCRNGVELVDSPGLNEGSVRTGVTTRYLAVSDAVILVLNAEQFLAENEKRFIELHLQPMGYDNVFYVTNKINRVEPEEREGVIRLARRRAAPFVDRDNRLFFVNAKGALDARRGGDDRAWQESGVGDVERYLERFLVDSKGRAKILGPARELRSAMTQIRKDIREREGLLDVDIEELRKRYGEAQQPLARLERRRDEIVRGIDNHNTTTRQEVVQAVRRQLERIADSSPGWVQEIETEHKLTLNPANAAAARERFTEELAAGLSHRMRTEFAEWLAGDFRKHLLERAEDLEERIGQDLADFERKIDEVRFDLNGLSGVDLGVAPSGGNRLAAAIAGFLLVDVTSAYTGSMYGFKEMAKSAVPRVAIILTGIALAMNPLVIIGLLLSTALIDTFIKKGAAEKKIRTAVGEQAREGLRARAGEDAEAVAAQLDEQLATTRAAVVSALTNEVEDVRRQVEAVPREGAGRDHRPAGPPRPRPLQPGARRHQRAARRPHPCRRGIERDETQPRPRLPNARTPSRPVRTPIPTRPAAVRPSGPERTVTSEWMTAGPGTAAGCSCSFSFAVAAHAVTNRMKRDTKNEKTSRPRNGPINRPLGDSVTEPR